MDRHGLYGPRPGSGEPVDPERTPVVCHPKPAPVVVRSGEAASVPIPPPLPRRSTPLGLGKTLAPLARVSARPEACRPGNGQDQLAPPVKSDPFPDEEAPTPSTAAPHLVNKHLRVYLALQPEDRQLVHALALRLLPGSR